MMRRGEIRLVDLEPVRGAESNRRRPAVIVSNDRANETAARLGRGVVAVVPVTSNTDHIYPFQVFLGQDLPGVRVDSKAQAEQVRSVSVDRLGPALGRLPARVVDEIDRALRLHLDL
ncbi:type II toxin-antitoxin system PemK/MazF family toxin [Nocardia sp. NEAU-G5]|uniref:mRNA interferase n=1 Tax=Nocardia albiluteola TaxID=2842303 RepID=A0ABS6AQD5_9NOCA|nr:type II toxin-antitoxin system PemK/MazF family toxin [Nocardia albiluteola]MBU3060232.1 type II toxin-antitoxin system PemK/MazF family toxin [Nocardia albiluteola]